MNGIRIHLFLSRKISLLRNNVLKGTAMGKIDFVLPCADGSDEAKRALERKYEVYGECIPADYPPTFQSGTIELNPHHIDVSRYRSFPKIRLQ